MRKMTILLLAACVFIALGVLAVWSQNAPKTDRVSGTIARTNPEKSTLIIKEHKSNIERTVVYNNSTKWMKDAKATDMSEFKDGSRVVCIGKFDENKVLTATRCDLQK